MKGIIILIVILAVLGIWWAKRTPEPVTGVQLQPESVSADDESVLDAEDNGFDDPAENEDKG